MEHEYLVSIRRSRAMERSLALRRCETSCSVGHSQAVAVGLDTHQPEVVEHDSAQRVDEAVDAFALRCATTPVTRSFAHVAVPSPTREFLSGAHLPSTFCFQFNWHKRTSQQDGDLVIRDGTRFLVPERPTQFTINHLGTGVHGFHNLRQLGRMASEGHVQSPMVLFGAQALRKSQGAQLDVVVDFDSRARTCEDLKQKYVWLEAAWAQTIRSVLSEFSGMDALEVDANETLVIAITYAPSRKRKRDDAPGAGANARESARADGPDASDTFISLAAIRIPPAMDDTQLDKNTKLMHMYDADRTCYLAVLGTAPDFQGDMFVGALGVSPKHASHVLTAALLEAHSRGSKRAATVFSDFEEGRTDFVHGRRGFTAASFYLSQGWALMAPVLIQRWPLHHKLHFVSLKERSEDMLHEFCASRANNLDLISIDLEACAERLRQRKNTCLAALMQVEARLRDDNEYRPKEDERYMLARHMLDGSAPSTKRMTFSGQYQTAVANYLNPPEKHKLVCQTKRFFDKFDKGELSIKNFFRLDLEA